MKKYIMSFNSFGSFFNSDGLIQKPKPSTKQMLTTNVKPASLASLKSDWKYHCSDCHCLNRNNLLSYCQLIVNLWQLGTHLVSNLSLIVCTTLLHNQISSNSQVWPTMASAALQPLDTCRQEDEMRASFLSEVMKQKSQKTSSSSFSSSSSPSSSPSCFWLYIYFYWTACKLQDLFVSVSVSQMIIK